MGTPLLRANSRTTGSVLRSSSSAGTGCDPGRVDSPPTSMRSAPSAASRKPCSIAASGAAYFPPSENESGVTFRIAITRTRPSGSLERGNRQRGRAPSTWPARVCSSARSARARPSSSASARLRAADQSCDKLPRASPPRSPRSTATPDCRSPSWSRRGSEGNSAAHPRRFGSTALRPIAVQAAVESHSVCNSTSRMVRRVYAQASRPRDVKPRGT